VAPCRYVRIYAKKQTRYLYRIPAAAAAAEANSGDGGGGGGGGGGGALRPKKQRSGGAAAQGNLSAVGRAIEQDGVLEKFPLLAEAEYSEAILGPGDALYMAAGVWHYVRSLETSLSINYWF
jgi:lysine-specific demethylase 8